MSLDRRSFLISTGVSAAAASVSRRRWCVLRWSSCCATTDPRQDPEVLSGKVLRIDADGPDGSYYIRDRIILVPKNATVKDGTVA